MERYDPEQAPTPADWLSLDEDEQIHLVEAFHREARVPLPKAARAAHASIHTVVENQLALADEPIVRALARLMKEGLSRHDAVHAIGSVLAKGVYDVIAKEDPGDTFRARYYAAVERLSAASWHANRDDQLRCR